MAETSVRWNARNLRGRFNVGFGNHHYILVVADAIPIPNEYPKLSYAGHDFFTLGGFSVGGNMVMKHNNHNDVTSAKECLDGGGFWEFVNPADWGTQSHIIRPPNGCPFSFASDVCRLARNYERNTAINPHPYDIYDDNCASWVNTLFKVLGLTKRQRQKYGEFWGMDWGEEDPIPESLFR